ncbi:hypothetical protein COEREDRAFT_85379 [Coemansia reversa NRRL 1564]|uniref:Uncharacterized protein n=1 Tax=Coemansia reversa (strain ATCC 12441 / NRRL 1564) TaxID=763665 RepID=A0A2G5BHD1_COERN|nr:hypothetical protein COEREDRAFT_85379 [Coemansia reversa NRRL 1564]|eukprot:PIA18419.1 hypothetical protein COEREDRAFT_85379 [Coemansia reversa NRRL 1564]
MEFSQRPAHPTLSNTHGFITAAAATAPTSAHYSYAGQDPRQAFYGSPVYAHHQQQQQQQVDKQSGNPRRLPSVSELLVSQDTSTQQAMSTTSLPSSMEEWATRLQSLLQKGYAGENCDFCMVAAVQHSSSYAPRFSQSDPQPQQLYMTGAYSHGAYQTMDAPKAYAIDVPGVHAAGYVAQAHRDSESSSSVSSQTTIIGNYSPTTHYSAAKQQQQQLQSSADIDRACIPVATCPRAIPALRLLRFWLDGLHSAGAWGIVMQILV